MARGFFLSPLRDTQQGLERCLERAGATGLFLLLVGLVAGWWIYVPLHELLHALACLAAGGEVTRLEIDPLYGGAILARVIPWVEASTSPYAGRLSGFDTGGSDLVYLLTDLGPFVLTLFPGVWWLRRAGEAGHSLLFGASLPFALAPFLSLTGDAYEIGSILVTRLPPWSGAGLRGLIRGEDLLVVAPALAADPGHGSTFSAWLGLVLAVGIGVLWALETYRLGAWIAERAQRRRRA